MDISEYSDIYSEICNNDLALYEPPRVGKKAAFKSFNSLALIPLMHFIVFRDSHFRDNLRIPLDLVLLCLSIVTIPISIVEGLIKLLLKIIIIPLHFLYNVILNSRSHFPKIVSKGILSTYITIHIACNAMLAIFIKDATCQQLMNIYLEDIF